jgi:hypothetical protein
MGDRDPANCDVREHTNLERPKPRRGQEGNPPRRCLREECREGDGVPVSNGGWGQIATVRWSGREEKGRRQRGRSSRAVIQLSVHCEELDGDGDGRDMMGNAGDELVAWLPVRM